MILAQQVRRPLVGIALSIAIGLGVQRWIGGSPLLILSGAAFLLAVAGRVPFGRRTVPLIYLICALLAAAYSAIEATPSFSRAALSAAEVTFGEQELTGVVADEPSVSDLDGSTSFLFRATTVRYGEKRFPAKAVLRVYLKEGAAPVCFGEAWSLRGVYTGYEQPRSGADGALSVRAGGAIRLQPAGRSLMSACYGARRRAAEILQIGISGFSDQIKLLHALLLGYRRALPPELYQMFSRTGTLHIFAISGLHVGVMAAILIAVLKIAGIPKPRWGLLLIPALFLYVFSTGMKPSALRAFTMAAVYFAAPLAGRRPDAPSAVALAAILLLIVRPANIGDPGFLLSFVVVCGILMVHGWVARQINGFHASGWAAPLKQLNGTHPAAALVRSIGMLSLTSVAAWLFSAPVTAYFFNTLSPAALIGNLAVIPLTFMIMLTGCLTLLSGALFFPAAALFNQANLLFIGLLIWIVRLLFGLPGTCWSIPPPSGWSIGVWYTGLIIFFTGPTRWRKGALLLLLLFCLSWAAMRLTPCRDIQILREGDAAVAMWLPDRKQWVLVTDGSPFNITRTIRLLQREGISRLQELVISDPQADPAAVRQLLTVFCPEQTRNMASEDELYWPTGAGTVRFSPER